MLIIWAVAVFGFQILLRVIEKPTPEKALNMFESTWSSVQSDQMKDVDYKTFLNSLVLVKGKNIVKPVDQKVLSDAISCVLFNVVPDSIKSVMLGAIGDLKSLKSKVAETKDQEYLDLKTEIAASNKTLLSLVEPYSGFKTGSLESNILISSLHSDFPDSFKDDSFEALPGIMTLYLTHNQSVLTDTPFLGFPFHYFYTAVFLLIMFIVLCIVYNLLIEWRLGKQGIVE
jgi:hypothetical protein